MAEDLDLRALDLAPGGATALAVPAGAVELRLAGQEYRIEPSEPELRLDVSRSLTGYHLRLRGAGELSGPCMRCMEDTRVDLTLDASEFAAEGRRPGEPFDDDLDSVYVEDGRLALGRWVHDAFAEAVPLVVRCPDGRCASPEAEEDAEAEAGDPRWAPLRDLAARLERGEGG